LSWLKPFVAHVRWGVDLSDDLPRVGEQTACLGYSSVVGGR
jgi:hypothetical protein